MTMPAPLATTGSGRLAGKVAIVTCAAGAGIGQAVARRYALEGAKVVVTDAHPERPLALARELESEYGGERSACRSTSAGSTRSRR